MSTFPKDFMWGTATSAHQVEGNNHNDWTEWEPQNAERLAREAAGKFAHLVPDWDRIKPEATDPRNYSSGRASGHYEKFREDIEIIASLGLKAYRFSIEWARIEPEQGQWNEEAINHYRNVIATLKRHNIEPFVTLHHRTNPLWIRDIGDWENRETVHYFVRYVNKVVELFKNDVRYWMPINEPVLTAGGAYLSGQYPPNKKNPIAALRVFHNLITAHNRAYTAIHRLRSDAQVGIPHAAAYTEGYKNHWYNRIIATAFDFVSNWLYLNAIRKHVDFIGVQYYTRGVLRLTLGKNWLPTIEQVQQPGPESDMGWEIYPQGLYNFLLEAWQRYQIPLIVTENGIADALDDRRATYIEQHIAAVSRALGQNVDIRGYFYWSLLDNLEWDKGFWPRFGLVEVDFDTLQRRVRTSAEMYSSIVRNNAK